MIDSELLQSKSFEEVLISYGKKPDNKENGIIQQVGLTARDNFKILKEKYHINEKLSVLLKKKNKIYKILLEKNIKPKFGLIYLLKMLKKNSFFLAVASSSKLKYINLVLNHLQIRKYFNVVVSGESVNRGKPNPEIYLQVSKELGIPTGNCLVLEDAPSGIEAAKSAGMRVIAVPDKYTKNSNFSKADLVVSSLPKVTLKKIYRL